MTTIMIANEVTVLEKKEYTVQTVRVLHKVVITKGFNSLPCNGHAGPIGSKRPIFLVWASDGSDKGRSYRICYECGKHLLDCKELIG